MTEYSPTFANRKTAGRALARQLAQRELSNPVILALPRGGVPVAFEIAQELGAPLDLVMVRKLGAPGHSEYAIGAIVDGEDPEVFVDHRAAAASGASEKYVTRMIAMSLKEIRRRRSEYGLDFPPDLKGRTVVLVDDGIATGSTAKVALEVARKAGARRIILAVPVAPSDALSALEPLCDEIVCLLEPRQFFAVGAHYDDFGQTSDAEVIRYISLARESAKQVDH